jgi:hypothetical protein
MKERVLAVYATFENDWRDLVVDAIPEDSGLDAAMARKFLIGIADADIRLEEGPHIDWIVLDRPSAANAFASWMLEQFSATLAHLSTQGAPVIGIRSGGKGFGSGVDLGAYNAAATPVDDVMRLRTH